MAADIVAAGGVLVRRGPDGPEILIVHRPRYDDWTLPKGKIDTNESLEACALREVEEETGIRARIVGELGKSRYTSEGLAKVVHWFVMREVRSQTFEPTDEVEQIKWVPLKGARKLLSYPKDAEVLASFDPDDALTTGVALLLRHAAAGSRSEWSGDDVLRPLSGRGQHQATALADAFSDRPIERILTSPYVRCRETVEPLAETLGLKVEEREELVEGAGHKPARDLLRELVGSYAVLCSHGDVIPEVLDWLAKHGTTLRSPFDCKKASTWEIEVKGGQFAKARYLPPPL